MYFSKVAGEVHVVDILEQVSRCPALDRRKQVILILGHREHNNLAFRHLGLDQSRGLYTATARHPDIHQDHIGLHGPGQMQRLESIMRHSDNLHAL